MSRPSHAEPRGGFFLQVMPALLYTFAIFYGGLAQPPQVQAPSLFQQDKLLHAIAFGFMQLVVFRAVRFEGQRLGFRGQNLLALGLTVAAGGLLELVQLGTAHRSAELFDFVADALGAGVVAVLLDRFVRPGAERARQACAAPREPEG